MQQDDRTLGAYVTFEQLASYHVFARQLPLKRNHMALSQLAGPYKTRIRGRGLEFEDIRLYQNGDDIRTIDWRVSARTQETYTKQFSEEKERPVLIVVDQRHSMFFGSQKATKSVLAADLAAYIAWAALQKGDRVGGLIFNEHSNIDIRPKRQRKTIVSLIHHLVEYNNQLKSFHHTKGTSLDEILFEVHKLARPGMQIFLISDFHDLTTASASLIHQIARHTELTALKPFDPLEAQLPIKGDYVVSDGDKTATFNASNKKTRIQYKEDFKGLSSFIKQQFGERQVPVIPVSTADNPKSQLIRYFSQKPAGMQAFSKV